MRTAPWVEREAIAVPTARVTGDLHRKIVSRAKIMKTAAGNAEKLTP